jgi:hypothetical protein
MKVLACEQAKHVVRLNQLMVFLRDISLKADPEM